MTRRRMSKKDRDRRIASMIKRDGQACWWCKRPLERAEITIEHVKPVSAGGTNRLQNLRLACGPCNHRRGGFHTPGSFVAAGTPSIPREAIDGAPTETGRR